jgi:hypothetical protein
MCFFVHPDHIQEQVATEDIPCIKILREGCISFFFHFPYEVGKLYELDGPLKLDGPLSPDEWGQIARGFHSFQVLHTVNSNITWFEAKWCELVQCVKARFTIPAGAHYYVNPKTGEYVSNAIRFDSIIDNP